MASPVTWEQLRELASFRATRGCAVSLYMGLDPSMVPTPGDLASHTRSLLARAERQADEQRAALSHAERKALAGDIDRIASWFDSAFSREGVRGVVVFAADLDGLFRPLLLPWPVADDARLAQRLYLAPLVRGIGRGDGAVVAYVGRERGDVYRLRGGELSPLADETAEVPGRHDQGGWSQARYERHIETIVDRHLRELADALDRCVRRIRGARVVLVGPDETRAGFESMLSSEVRAALLGWAAADAHVDAPGLLEAARPLLDGWRAGREDELLLRWREEAGRSGRAATGLDLAVHQTLTHGGTVEVIGEEHRDLEPVGGVAALLRF